METNETLIGNTSQDMGLIYKVTWVGLAVNVILAGLKLAAGWFGHSRALVADGVHSLTDLATDVALLLGARYWSAPADENHPHGHGRIETLVTAFIGLCLAGAGAGIALDAVKAFGQPSPRPQGVALAAAMLSVLVKEVLYRWTALMGRRAKSRAVEANAWHHRSDALSSLPAGAAVGVAMFFPDLAFIDAVGALAVSGFICYAAWKVTMPALSELIDRGASRQMLLRIEDEAMRVEGVREVHAVRSRSLGQGLQVDMHVLVDPQLSVEEGHAIAEAVCGHLLREIPQLADVITHLEPYPESHAGRNAWKPSDL